MRNWLILGAALAAIALSYGAGYRRGLDGCPERAAQEAERDARIDQDVARLLAAPGPRSRDCEAIFDIVRGGLSRDQFLEDQERDRF